MHRHLSWDIHNEKVSVSLYFHEIIENYKRLNNDCLFDLTSDPIEISSEKIIYFGLILNELLSNTIKHRRTHEQPVEIKVANQKTHYSFLYQDGSETKEEAVPSTGTELISSLIERIEGFDFIVNKNNGKIKFNFYA